ncbi:MAG: acetyl-CoA carboxylase biotin carboxyl carrier protein [Candidatus Riflebacteria bacterium HGW-Riflebacteria-2]|jgi:acetyl-CoA carboxylase biotin carboxyl carrier protein|nr:MAG: acetyl-CoA carboxylase biotin carboxyl carrier protein [Candidatus Riflebacteria bacterium HGW-Riflebacteria-2]
MAKTRTVQNSEGQVVDQVVEIIRFMGENKLAEIDLETSQMKLKLKKHGNVPVHTVQIPAHQSYMPTMPVFDSSNAPANANTKKPAAEKPVEADTKHHKIISPMAGTFYRAPSPTSEPFCKEGDSITVGQTVCIVEAMKMMNEIKADKAGKVVKILLENGKPVEKGVVLFHIGD